MADLEKERHLERLLAEANLWRARGEPEKAEARCREAVALDPRNAEARELHGDLLQLLGELEQALEEYAEALRLQPHRPTAEVKYARVTLAIEAEKRRAELFDPRNPEAVIRLETLRARLKSPVNAFALSLVLPGLGQIYLGDKNRGIVILGSWILLLLIFSRPLLEMALRFYVGTIGAELPTALARFNPLHALIPVLLAAIALWSAWDAYRMARGMAARLNAGLPPAD